MIEENRYHKLHTKLNKLKEKAAELRGERQSVMKQVQEQGCTTVDEIKKKIAKEKQKSEDLKELLDKKLTELEENYSWD